MTPLYKSIWCILAVSYQLSAISLSGQDIPPLAVAPRNGKTIVWDGGKAKEWKVSFGPARGVYTNALFTTNAFIRQTNGLHYKIEAFKFIYSDPVYWPSNPVVQRVVEVHDLDKGGMKEYPWMIYTNAPEGKGALLRVRDDFLRWE